MTLIYLFINISQLLDFVLEKLPNVFMITLKCNNNNKKNNRVK